MAHLGLSILSHVKSPTKAGYTCQEPIEYQDDLDCLLLNQLLSDYMGLGANGKELEKF